MIDIGSNFHRITYTSFDGLVLCVLWELSSHGTDSTNHLWHLIDGVVQIN